MVYSYKLHRDINQDAWNWWDACNAINFGTDWSKKIDLEVAKRIKGKKRQEAYSFLKPYLNKMYRDDKPVLDQNFIRIKKLLDLNFRPACDKLVEVMGRPLYRNDFDFFLTTFPSLAIDQNKGYIWLEYYYLDPIANFLHELCHMQFIHFWREVPDSPVSKLSNEQFEDLKEALTIVIDQDFFPLISEADAGYKVHQNFRNLLKVHWAKEKDFEKLVNFALENIKMQTLE